MPFVVGLNKTASASRSSAARSGNTPTTSVQRSVSLFSRSVEVFADASSATIRQQRLGQLEKNAPLLASEYTFTNGPVLLRVSGRLTPAQAAEYAVTFRR